MGEETQMQIMVNLFKKKNQKIKRTAYLGHDAAELKSSEHELCKSWMEVITMIYTNENQDQLVWPMEHIKAQNQPRKWQKNVKPKGLGLWLSEV